MAAQERKDGAIFGDNGIEETQVAQEPLQIGEDSAGHEDNHNSARARLDDRRFHGGIENPVFCDGAVVIECQDTKFHEFSLRARFAARRAHTSSQQHPETKKQLRGTSLRMRLADSNGYSLHRVKLRWTIALGSRRGLAGGLGRGHFDAEEFRGIVQQNLGADRILERKRGKLFQPALGRHHRKIRAEEGFVLDECVDVVNR